MLPQKQGEETMMSSLNETVEREEREDEKVGGSHSSLRSFLWHGGSVYDAWFSCASNQVAQVLLTLPYSFAQLGMLSGIIFQVFYGIMGSWTAYLISILYIEYRSRKEKENVSFKNHVIQWFEVLEGLLGPYWKAIGLAFNCTFLLFGSVIQLIACASNIYYINDHLDKRTWTYIFGACCATTVFVPSFHNYRIWSFLGLGMTTYTAWYLTIAAIVHGQVENVTHTGPKKMVLYFTGATNILYTFGGHAVTVEIMHAMWKPQKLRVCTIKFACPSKPSAEVPSKPATAKPRRMASPAPPPRRIPSSPKPTQKVHRDSDSTVRNNSPVSVRKARPVDRTRRLSSNSDLARCEAYRFHEFASSEEEVEEWTQEVTCHRSRLTVQDTLKIENNLRKLGEEVAEEEAIDEEDEEEDEEDDIIEMDDDDDDLLDQDQDDSDAHSDTTDEGFQTDDENGFAVSDDDSDAGSDYNWWAPGASTAATSVEHLEQLRLKPHRAVSESSIGSLESREGLKIMDKPSKRRKSKPVNIRAPSPELPDSTDFVCGTLDEDRPAEAAYMSTLERRRAAKHKPTPQDIDPTFPTSDPELPDDEEDEISENENLASETDHLMMHGRMDPDADLRGRRKDINKKRSPLPSPKRLRSPPPAKRAVHRSPPPRKLFGNSSPKRLHSPPPPMRLRSPPPTRRGSVNPLAARQRSDMSIRFAGIAERPAPTVSASVPRTPVVMNDPFDLLEEDDADASDMPVRRAIDIKVGLEKKRQRRKEKLYRKQHRKGAKEKRPAPGRGAERMREMGLAVHAHKGKTTAFQPFQICHQADEEDMHVLSA